jgi:integrase/recombinase XerC
MQIEAFKQYLEVERHQSSHTVEAYVRDLRQFEVFLNELGFSGDDHAIKSSMVRQWIAQWMDQDIEVSSLHRKLASVSGYFRYANKRGWADHNPVKGIKKPKLKKRLPEYLEQQQTEQLYSNAHLDHFKDYLAQMIVQFLYETGLRRAELMGLKHHDIDKYNSQIKVLGKRNKMRIVPINADLMKRLEAFVHDQREYFQKEKGQDWNQEYLFLGMDGKPLTPGKIYPLVKGILGPVTTKQKKSPHLLRHTFATQMLNEGADLNVIKEILGHSSLAATQVYTHVSISKLKQMHEKLHPRND